MPDLTNDGSGSSRGSGGTLRRGSKGPAVAALQRKIGVTADGDFGPATERALVAWQKAHGLTADGVAGPQTQAALNGAAAPAPATTRPAPAPSTGGITLDSFLNSLGQHESGNNYTARNGTSTASGKYQWLDSTWNGYGGYAHAWQAPASVQEQRAHQDVQGLYAKYGDWDKVAAAWFAGSGWVDKHPDKSSWNQNPAPGSQNPAVSSYVSGVVGGAGGSAGGSGGGGRLSAPTPGGSTTSTVTAPNTPYTPAAQAKTAADFGFTDSFFNSDPSLKKLLSDAIAGGWDDKRFQGELQNTSWYKAHTAAQQKAVALKTGSPKEYQDQVDKNFRKIVGLSTELGVQLSYDQANKLAISALTNGWTDDEIQHYVGGFLKFDPSHLSGQASTTAASVKGLAADYGVPLSDAAVADWTKRMVSGDIDEKAFTGYLISQAKSLYQSPDLHNALDQGMTLKQYADPYAQLAAQTLEINPASIDWRDPKWSKALNNVGADGKRNVMSLSDWSATLRTDSRYGYDVTNNARSEAAKLQTELLQRFGNVA